MRRRRGYDSHCWARTAVTAPVCGSHSRRMDDNLRYEWAAALRRWQRAAARMWLRRSARPLTSIGTGIRRRVCRSSSCLKSKCVPSSVRRAHRHATAHCVAAPLCLDWDSFWIWLEVGVTASPSKNSGEASGSKWTTSRQVVMRTKCPTWRCAALVCCSQTEMQLPDCKCSTWAQSAHCAMPAMCLPNNVQNVFSHFACTRRGNDTLFAFAHSAPVSLWRLESFSMRFEWIASAELTAPDVLMFREELLLVGIWNNTIAKHAIVSLQLSSSALTEKRVLLDNRADVWVGSWALADDRLVLWDLNSQLRNLRVYSFAWAVGERWSGT